MQPMLPVMINSWIADSKNAIQELWERLEYHGSHRRNSLRKHIACDTLSECSDLDVLERYLAYLEGKYNENPRRSDTREEREEGIGVKRPRGVGSNDLTTETEKENEMKLKQQQEDIINSTRYSSTRNNPDSVVVSDDFSKSISDEEEAEKAIIV